MKRAPTSPKLLITDRNALVLLERARVHVSKGRVVYYATDTDMLRRFNLPHANVAVLMLGQGTSISQEAVVRLAQEGVLVAFSGTGGTPLHMGTLVSYKPTERFRAMVPIYASPEHSLVAAKSLMQQRTTNMLHFSKKLKFAHQDLEAIKRACEWFDKASANAPRHEHLLSAEGAFAKRIYAANTRGNKAEGFVRNPGEPGLGHPEINGMLDHGNYLAYGITGAAIWALGIPAHMSVMHGKTRAGGFVFDVSDVWKDSIVLPLAVQNFLKGGDEQDFRTSVIDAIEDLDLLALNITAVDRMIADTQAATGVAPAYLHFPGKEKNQ